MKFTKFLKEIGTQGEVIEIGKVEKWLVCGGVGMLIPRGVNNLLGSESAGDKFNLVKSLRNESLNDELELTKAILRDPNGNAKSIYRVFESELGETIEIINSKYGLLDKADILGYTELIESNKVVKYMLIFNGENLIGFIRGDY